MEKIIADRLMYHLEKKNLLNGNHAGFRSGRSTVDQVLKLSQSATDKIQNREKDSATLCCFFNYEMEFDKVWREGLLFKMAKMDIPPRYIKYVRQFLSGRKTKVQINGVNSKEFYLNEGLPQGSSISPLLFIIYINDIDKGIKAEFSLFADDTVAWIGGDGDRDSTERRMQEVISGVGVWARRWKMKINEDKTKAMIITSSAMQSEWRPNLEIKWTAGGDGQDLQVLGC